MSLQLDEELFTGFQIQFNVTKTVKSAPRNKATIRIFNVSEDVYEHVVSRARELYVRLNAGYGVAALVFEGNPVKNGVSFDWSGGDKILAIEAQDGYRAYQRGRVSLTLDASSTRMSDLVIAAANAMRLPVDMIDLGGDNVELTQGTVLHGSAAEILDRVAAATGGEWSIQNGKIQMIPRQKTRRTSGPLYGGDLNNIIDFPKFTDEGIKLTTFLDSSIVPGDRFSVQVSSGRFDGIYKAHSVSHNGSLMDGGAWTTEVQGRRWVEAPPPKPDVEPKDVELPTFTLSDGTSVQGLWPIGGGT